MLQSTRSRHSAVSPEELALWVVQYGATKSEKQQGEMKETNRKKVINTTLKFMKSENRWVVKERWAEAMLR